MLGQHIDMIASGLTHCGISDIEAHQTESGINHCPLTPPLGTVGNEHTLANQWIERSYHQVAFGKDAFLVAHDLFDRGGIVEQHRATP